MATTNRGTAQPPSNNSGNKPLSEIEPFGGLGKGFPEMYTARLDAILRSGEKINIAAPLPENYQFELSTSYDNPFNQPLSNFASMFGNGPGQAVDAISTGATMASGKSTINKWMSGAVWTGGSLFQITVPFVLRAYESTRSEIVDVMRDMLKLVAPSESGTGMLTAPGPNMASAFGATTNGDDITIRIGKFFVMRPCVIQSVTCDFDTQMDVDGQAPLSATITVNAISFWATTKQDLDKYFKPQ